MDAIDGGVAADVATATPTGHSLLDGCEGPLYGVTAAGEA